MSYAEVFAATLSALRLWVRCNSFAEYVPKELQSATGYRTDSTDTRVADAICDLWQREQVCDAIASKRQLGRLAGVSPNAALAAVRRLAGWFIHVGEVDADGQDFGLMRLIPGDFAVRTLTTHYEELQKGGQSTTDTCEPNEYSSRKTADPWLTGTSPTVRRWARENIHGTEMTAKEWLELFTQAGLGETALRICDALARCGDMTAKELADETGKTVGAIRRGVRALETASVVQSERENTRAPKVYSLPRDWSDRVDAMRPSLRTYQLGDWREERRLHESLCWLYRRATLTTDEKESAQVRRRRTQLETQRAAVLLRLHPYLSAVEIWRMAKDVNVKEWTRVRAERTHRGRDTRLLSAWRETANLPSATRQRMMEEAGWNSFDIARAQQFAALDGESGYVGPPSRAMFTRSARHADEYRLGGDSTGIVAMPVPACLPVDSNEGSKSRSPTNRQRTEHVSCARVL